MTVRNFWIEAGIGPEGFVIRISRDRPGKDVSADAARDPEPVG